MASINSATWFNFCAIIFYFVSMVNFSVAVNYQVKFYLLEESEKWTFVGNVSSAAGFWDDVPTLDKNSLVFGFLTQTNLKSMLSIHDQTGALYTTVVVDREQIARCGVPTECTLNFDIAARSTRPESSYFEIISVIIIIEDINDNAPEFPTPIQYVNISESSMNGSSFLIDSAVDHDMGGNNSIQSYEVNGHDDKFALNVSKKLDGSMTVKLVVIGKLDRETKDSYVVSVVARDGGTAVKTGMTEIHINILDVNDNPPVLEKALYNITVREDIEIGAGFLQISATDLDIGRNGNITFRLSPHQSDLREIQNLFAIEGDTGILKVIGNIVYEPEKIYGIFVEAVDDGDPPLVSSNQAIVNVNILDTGNTQPTVEVNILSGVARVANVSENAGHGTFVAHVFVLDPDTGENGNISCSVPNPYFGIESMSRKGYYKVVVDGHLDRETQASHSLLVICRDHGVPVLTGTATFLVQLTDENDNEPIFTQDTYIENMYENNQKYEVVLTVLARDKDIGRNKEIYYYLGDEVGPRMTINYETGVITANVVYDREVTTKEIFTVFAEDKGSPLSSVGQAKVVINILDLNDNAPKFSKSIFEFSVSENLPSDTLVDTLTAVDIDEGTNAAFTYDVTNTTDPTLPFVVFPNGVIKTNQRLDREFKGSYEFMVKATDNGTPKKTSLAMVVVRVDDINDEEPVLSFPTEGNRTVSISHLESAGSKITQVLATDKDAGANKRLTYIISAGNEKRVFSLDMDTGELLLSREYIVQEDELFPLVISVHDGGVPQHSVRGELNVVIRYSNATRDGEFVDSKNNNIAIVVVVVVITVFLSIAIIVVICVIRKFDRNGSKHSNDQNNMSEMKEKNTQNGTILSRPYDKVEIPRKKKEVSFSFEDDLDGLDHEISFGNTSVFTDERQTELSMSERQPGQFKTFQLHQSLMAGSPPQVWNQSAHKQHEVMLGGNPEDSHSETSRETVNSDSGKGGSEEDLPISHNSFKDEGKECGLPVKNSSHVLRGPVPKDRRGVSPERSHSVVIEENNKCNNSSKDKSTKRQSLPIIMNEKPKFSVRRPYIEKEIRDTKAQTEPWVPSYV